MADEQEEILPGPRPAWVSLVHGLQTLLPARVENARTASSRATINSGGRGNVHALSVVRWTVNHCRVQRMIPARSREFQRRPDTEYRLLSIPSITHYVHTYRVQSTPVRRFGGVALLKV